jgi:hypothetical protein
MCNQDKIKFKECFVSFIVGSLVCQFAIHKYKDEDIQNYNIVCCFVWVWNMVAQIEGRRQAEGVWA